MKAHNGRVWFVHAWSNIIMEARRGGLRVWVVYSSMAR
jgi:hypothetical protein